jgi:hypothetical protein
MPDSGSSDRRRITSWDSADLGVQWQFLSPLVWAPAFPILRYATVRYPTARPWVIGGAIIVANRHGFWLIQNPDLSDL